MCRAAAIDGRARRVGWCEGQVLGDMSLRTGCKGQMRWSAPSRCGRNRGWAVKGARPRQWSASWRASAAVATSTVTLASRACRVSSAAAASGRGRGRRALAGSGGPRRSTRARRGEGSGAARSGARGRRGPRGRGGRGSSRARPRCAGHPGDWCATARPAGALARARRRGSPRRSRDDLAFATCPMEQAKSRARRRRRAATGGCARGGRRPRGAAGTAGGR